MNLEQCLTFREQHNGQYVQPKELVLGLHWDPPEVDCNDRPADLDAVCVLLDANRCILEMICPHTPHDAAGAVIHTGDSHDGASAWDDERVFVFLDALPVSVAAVEFLVCSVTGETFDQVKGARCHISDRETETQWLHVELTSLNGRTKYVVACVERSQDGWQFSEGCANSVVDLLPRVT